MKKIILIIGVLLIGNIYLYSDVLQNVYADYDCSNSVDYTVVSDNNSDGIYDTYTIGWCNGQQFTYPIVAVGDIEKWPPRGIPSRNITLADFSSQTFKEEYYSSKGQIHSWFRKYNGNDTVYFYSYNYTQMYFTGVNESIELPEFNIYPNPSTDFVNLSYSLNSSKIVRIYIYDEIGTEIAEFDNKLQTPGFYEFIIPTMNFRPGNYLVVVKFDLETVATRKLSIIK